MYPVNEPRVVVNGNDPARILIIGDAPAAGFGVRTHELGIAGHLARRLSSMTARGVTVTVRAQPTSSARSTLRAIDGVMSADYDAIVLMLTTTDGLCLTSRRSWRHSMTQLIHALRSTYAVQPFITSTADLSALDRLASIRRKLAGRHASLINCESRQICAAADLPLIQLGSASRLASDTYEKWARSIAASVAPTLVLRGVQPPRVRTVRADRFQAFTPAPAEAA